MKKLTILLASLFIAFASYAQNSLFEELAKYEGEPYYKYKLKYSSDNGKLTTTLDGKFDLTIVRDSYGAPIGISMKTEDQFDYMNHTYDPRYDRIDNYTNPAFCRHTNTTSTFKNEMAYVMVDGFLFAFIPTKEDLSVFGKKYDYGFAFVPESIVNGVNEEEVAEEGEGNAKKKNFGSKIKGFLNAAKTPAFFDHIPSTEALDEVINTYIAAMQKKQAANSLNAQDQSRWQEVKDMKDKAWDDLNDYNDAYWKSEEGQRVLKQMEEQNGNKCSFYIKNTSNQSIYYTTHLTPFAISPNQTSEFNCNEEVYRSNNSGDKLGLIGGGDDSYSGRTISIN